MFALQDNIDLQGSVHLLINHLGDTIILKNIETMKNLDRVGSFKVYLLSTKNSQPGLQSKFRDSQGYTEKPYLEKYKSKAK